MTHKSSGDQAFLADSFYGRVNEPTYSGALSFFRRRYSKDLEGVDVAVLGVPFDTATTNRSGARLGPRAIRAASSIAAWERPYPWEFDVFERLAVSDYGDCIFDFGRPQGVPAEIETQASEIVDAGVAILGLGGDHFATYPLLRAAAKKHGPLCLLHFDAHSDTWEDEEGRIDHGTMFFHAANEGSIEAAHSVQIGLRTTNDKPMDFNIMDAPWVHRHGVEAVIEKTKQVLGNRPVYLTFDIDCLDPAFAPGTGTPVCGGLSTTQALEIIRGLRGLNLVGMDLMEVAPAYDVSEITALAGASLAVEFLCLYATRDS
ncbi:MAG: agmatinase [Pseudomonadota bacterium]